MNLFDYRQYPMMLESRLPEAWDRAIIGASILDMKFVYSVPKMLTIMEEIHPEDTEEGILNALLATIVEPNTDKAIFADDANNDLPEDFNALESGHAGQKLLDEAEAWLNKHKSRKINAIDSVYFMALMDRYGKLCHDRGYLKGKENS